MVRADILTRIGRNFLKCNIENDEFNYQKALKGKGKDIKDYLVPNARRQYRDIDLRFANDKVTVLIETKPKLLSGNMVADIEQLQQYVLYERELTGNKVIAILYGTQDENIRVWTDNEGIVNDEHENTDERVIRTFNEYVDMFFGTKNDKLAVIRSTYALNELLHGYGIKEGIRSQFVGTCLLALKNGLLYEGLSAEQIRAGIESILSKLLTNDLSKAGKLFILKSKVVDSQDVRDLSPENFQHLLRDIDKNILPNIKDTNKAGQDLLNLFFTTFNKYVGKADKNQAFTPDHIVHFMCKVIGINRNSVVLDPCCGSGAFLVRAMTEAIADCDTEADKEKVKKKQIYGIEFEETAFGLSTTNMLIHGDGNSNIVQGSCFDDKAKFLDAGVNVVLMNPPYNAQRKHCCPAYTATWDSNKKEDPSKGFHFVYEIAEKVKTGKLAVLLPMQCAIGSSSDIQNYKTKMLEKHTLDAVFSLPSDMFHPGANTSACCMVFNLGTRHINAKHKETFFGFFKDDGFVKRKNYGRIEKVDKHGIGTWAKIETEWLNLYNKRLSVAGKSCVKDVTADDEWLAEAYMETDYSKLSQDDFEETVKNYLAYLVKSGGLDENK